MKRVLASLFAGALICLFFWLGGFDFDSRGAAAFCCAYLAFSAAGATYLFPGWKE